MENKILIYSIEPMLEQFVLRDGRLITLSNISISEEIADIKKQDNNCSKEQIESRSDSKIVSYFRYLQRFQSEIGEKGEQYILDVERRKLKNTDYKDKVEQISKKDNSAGYDILSFEENGTELYIEVKTTDNNDDIFFITQNELKKAENLKDEGKRYLIYRVVNILSSPSFYIIENLSKYTLEPIVWKAVKK